MEEDQATVPERYACPVCGKWGRVVRAYPNNHYYCNPKARRGGKGCGERFRRIGERNGCYSIASQVKKLIADQERLPRMVALGFELVEFMKAIGIHNPTERKITNRYLFNPFFEHKQAINQCPCGCGNDPIGNSSTGRYHRFAHHTCSDQFYAVSEMVTNQGERLRNFLIELRGCKCELCKADFRYKSDLEVDHIIEVKNGGGLCWIDNYQLLCIECHKAKTAKFAADRATARRIEKKVETGQQSLF